MKTLNLEQLGVQEMGAVKMKETDGGFNLWILGVGRITGVLDGIRGNSEWKWFWEK